MMRSICLTIGLSLATAAAAAPPQRVEIGYEVRRNGLGLAAVTQQFEHDGRKYRLTETTRGKGAMLRGEIVRTSEGAVVADGLRPVKYEDKRTGRDAQQAQFAAATRTATPLRQDRLSFIWTFAFAPPKGPVTVSVADGKGTTTYTYEPAGRERVKTPAGEFDALKLVKRRDGPEDRVTEIWLATERHYIPVRLLVVDRDGTRVDTLAAKIEAK
jgi:uncharacterized protein DUF3108